MSVWKLACGILLVSVAESLTLGKDMLLQNAPHNFLDEILEPKYRILLANRELGETAMDGSHLALMDASRNRQYCTLAQGRPQSHSAPQSEEQNRTSESTTLEEATSEIQDSCIYHFGDWWTYELCLGTSIRQYHVQGSKLEQEFSLGTYNDKLSDLSQITYAWSEVPYLKQVYDNGSDCDVALRKRSTEVWLTCSGQHKADEQHAIQSVIETHSCMYRIVVSSPALCRHKAFQKQEVPVLEIHCHSAQANISGKPESSNMPLEPSVLKVRDIFGEEIIPKVDAADASENIDMVKLESAAEIGHNSSPSQRDLTTLSEQELLELLHDLDHALEDVSFVGREDGVDDFSELDYEMLSNADDEDTDAANEENRTFRKVDFNDEL